MRISDWSSDVCSSDLLRFHLAPGVEPTPTADGMGALLRLDTGATWQFRANAGKLAIEESLWVDAEGRPHGTRQLAVISEALPGGSTVDRKSTRLNSSH